MMASGLNEGNKYSIRNNEANETNSIDEINILDVSSSNQVVLASIRENQENSKNSRRTSLALELSNHQDAAGTSNVYYCSPTNTTTNNTSPSTVVTNTLLNPTHDDWPDDNNRNEEWQDDWRSEGDDSSDPEHLTTPKLKNQQRVKYHLSGSSRTRQFIRPQQGISSTSASFSRPTYLAAESDTPIGFSPITKIRISKNTSNMPENSMDIEIGPHKGDKPIQQASKKRKMNICLSCGDSGRNISCSICQGNWCETCVRTMYEDFDLKNLMCFICKPCKEDLPNLSRTRNEFSPEITGTHSFSPEDLACMKDIFKAGIKEVADQKVDKDDFKQLLTEFSKLNTKVETMSTNLEKSGTKRIQEIEEKVTQNIESDICDITDSILESRQRRTHLILYNVPECNDPDWKVRLKTDSDAVERFLTITLGASVEKPKHLMRLGSQRTDGSDRPLRVILNTEWEKDSCLDRYLNKLR